MGSNYIPLRDNDLLAWAVNFDTVITATPADYKLIAADTTAIHEAVQAFVDAMLAINSPATRTSAAVLVKDEAKAAMLVVLRHYAMLIKKNMAVSNPLKAGLGLTIDDAVRSPIPAPTTQPLVNIIAATPLQHTLRFADAATPDKRSKPYGALGLQVFCHVGENPPADPEQWRFMMFVTSQPFAVDFRSEDVGKEARYMARWQTRTGLTGPWSTPVELTVAG